MIDKLSRIPLIASSALLRGAKPRSNPKATSVPLYRDVSLRRGRQKLEGRDGSVAVEAALILPVLFTIFFGMVEMSQAWTAKRRVQGVASAAADLVAQSSAVSTADLVDIAAIASQLMLPYSSTGLALKITSVAADASNNITAQWSCAWANLTSAPTCTTTAATYTGLPSGLVSAGQSVIVGQTTYTFRPTIVDFLTSGVTFSSTAYFRPRLVSYVTKT
jgi:Flp pilus assembly protein TadG